MGIIVSITDSKGRVIVSEKYDIGYPLLMFSRVSTTEPGAFGKQFGKNAVFEANGIEAKKNLEKKIKEIEAVKGVRNDRMFLALERSIMHMYKLIDEEETYFCDYSELLHLVDNPDFSPFESFISEKERHFYDVINSYTKYERDDIGFIDAAKKYIDGLSDDVNVIVTEKTSKPNVIFEVSVNLTNDEEEKVKKEAISINDDRYANELRERKLFYLLKNSDLSEFDFVQKIDNVFYLIINREYLSNWFKTKPYVLCTYQYSTTYPIPYLVRNTPDELEKFFCYAKTREGVIAITIDDEEVTSKTIEDVSKIIGKDIVLSENIDIGSIDAFHKR